MDGGHTQALKQKLRPAAPSAGQDGPRRAFRLALARAAEEFSGLQALVTGYQEHVLDLDEVLDRLDGAPVIYILAGPKETQGLVILDNDLQSAVLEHLTTGRVVPGEARPRTPTRVDTTLTGDFIATALRTITDETCAISGFPDFSAFAFSHTLNDKRAAEMALENMPFRMFEATIDLEAGIRSGRLTFFLPLIRPGQGTILSVGGWDRMWSEQVHRVEVKVEGILCRLKKSLNQVIELSPGQIVEIPRGRIENVALIGKDGRVIARAKLGRLGTHRALRIVPSDELPGEPGHAEHPDNFEAPAMRPHLAPGPPAAPQLQVQPADEVSAPPDDLPGPADGNDDLQGGGQGGLQALPMAVNPLPISAPQQTE